MDQDFQAEDDLRTLARAEEVRSSSKRMAACRRKHRRLTRAITKRGSR